MKSMTTSRSRGQGGGRPRRVAGLLRAVAGGRRCYAFTHSHVREPHSPERPFHNEGQTPLGLFMMMASLPAECCMKPNLAQRSFAALVGVSFGVATRARASGSLSVCAPTHPYPTCAVPSDRRSCAVVGVVGAAGGRRCYAFTHSYVREPHSPERPFHKGPVSSNHLSK